MPEPYSLWMILACPVEITSTLHLGDQLSRRTSLSIRVHQRTEVSLHLLSIFYRRIMIE